MGRVKNLFYSALLGTLLSFGANQLNAQTAGNLDAPRDSSKTEYTETIKPIRIGSMTEKRPQEFLPALKLSKDRNESGMDRIFWIDLLPEQFLRGNSVEGGFFGIFPTNYSLSSRLANETNELRLTDRKGGFIRASNVIRLGNSTSIGLSENFSFSMPGSIVLPGRNFLGELEMRALFKLKTNFVNLGIGPIVGIEIEVENETTENTPLKNPNMKEMQVNLTEIGFVSKVSKSFGKTFIEAEIEPVWEKQSDGSIKYSRTTGGVVLTFGRRFATTVFLGKGKPSFEKPYSFENVLLGLSYAWPRGSVGLRYEEEKVDDPKNGKYNNRSLDLVYKQLYNDRFYTGFIIGLHEINGSKEIVPQIFIGIRPKEEKWESAPGNYKLTKPDLRYPYPLRIALTNEAHLSIARGMPIFPVNSVDFEFKRWNPNMDAKTLDAFLNLERLRHGLDITGQILRGSGILPLWKKTGLSLMMGGYYQSLASRSGSKEDVFGISPGIILQMGRGFAGMGGVQFLRDGYGVYLGLSPRWGNVGFGAEFGWDDRARILRACGEFFPSDRFAVSFLAELYRKNGLDWGKGRSKFMGGANVFLTDGLYLGLSGLWSTNNDARYGMESMRKYGGWLELTNWLSKGLYVRGSIGLTENMDEPWDIVHDKAQNYVTSLEWNLGMGYAFGRKVPKLEWTGKKNGKGFPFYKNEKNAEGHNDASNLLSRFLKANNFEYGFESAKHQWPDDAYKVQYEKFYKKWYAYDFARKSWDLNLLFNPLKNLGIGIGAHGMSGTVLDAQDNELEIVPLKLVYRPVDGKSHVKSDITAGLVLSYKGETIDISRPGGVGIFYGMSFSKVLLGCGADFWSGGKVRKFWAGAEVHPYKNGVVSIYASGSPPHEQLLVLGADVRFLNFKNFEAALTGSFKLWHNEDTLGAYYPLSNEPGKLFEGLEATAKFGMTVTIGGIFYIGGEYFQTHFLSPPGPYLKGGRVYLGIKLKKSGFGAGESGRDDPFTLDSKSGIYLTKEFVREREEDAGLERVAEMREKIGMAKRILAEACSKKNMKLAANKGGKGQNTAKGYALAA